MFAYRRGMEDSDGKKQRLYKEIGDQIAARREAQSRTRKDVYDRLGISRQRYESWENGIAMPRPVEMAALADELGISEAELLRGKRSLARDVLALMEDETGLGEHGHVRRVPIVSWVAASQFGGTDDPYPVGGNEDFTYVVNVGPRCFALRVQGPSMEPRFFDGDLVVVDSERQAKPGDFVVVARDEGQDATFKQLTMVDGARWLKPLNPQFPAFVFPRDGRICGVVVRRIEEF